MVVGYHHFWKHPYIYIYSIYLYRTRWYWSGTYFRVELTSYDLADGETPVFLWFVWCFSMRNLHIATIDVMGAYWMRSCFVWQIPPKKIVAWINFQLLQIPTIQVPNWKSHKSRRHHSYVILLTSEMSHSCKAHRCTSRVSRNTFQLGRCRD